MRIIQVRTEHTEHSFERLQQQFIAPVFGWGRETIVTESSFPGDSASVTDSGKMHTGCFLSPASNLLRFADEAAAIAPTCNKFNMFVSTWEEYWCSNQTYMCDIMKYTGVRESVCTCPQLWVGHWPSDSLIIRLGVVVEASQSRMSRIPRMQRSQRQHGYLTYFQKAYYKIFIV